VNAPVRVEQIGWEVVKGHTYQMSADDFTSGVVVTDAASGRTLGTGKTKFGLTVTVPLFTPLCGGCDEPVGRDGVCSGCCLVHADIAESGEAVWL